MSSLEPGSVLENVEIGPVAHGGHFVARHEGLVLFVRHALTGELADVRITEVRRRFARADVVAVRRPSPHRVSAPCPVAGRCGGCDFQHVEPAYTRELKRRVVAELLGHLAGYEFTGEVEQVRPSPLGWRSRMRYHFGPDGRPGLRAHRSAEVIALPEDGCRIAERAIAVPPSAGFTGELLAISAADGPHFVPAVGGDDFVSEKVAGQRFRVASRGFWQAHLTAPQELSERVIRGLTPRPGELGLDLYCGVGVFAGALALAGATVWGVDADPEAVELAGLNVPDGRFVAGDVLRQLRRLPRTADLVVLDPPRAGAGQAVIAAIASRHPRAVAYVACDPAALGRDLRAAGELGYRPTRVSALDLFPLTHHIECVAILEPS